MKMLAGTIFNRPKECQNFLPRADVCPFRPAVVRRCLIEYVQ
jgi:hypothetical protein